MALSVWERGKDAPLPPPLSSFGDAIGIDRRIGRGHAFSRMGRGE
jgi:hypothetical protein